MAKNTSKKRLNRKSRRILRKGIAGILMVTSIAIAAIPSTPIEAQIENPETETETTSDLESYLTSNSLPFQYGVFSDGSKIENTLVDSNDKMICSPESTNLIYDSSMASKAGTSYIVEDGTYSWQFKYFTTNAFAGVSYAVIYDYNDAIVRSNVDVPNKLVTEYKSVSAADFSDFVNNEISDITIGLKYDEMVTSSNPADRVRCVRYNDGTETTDTNGLAHYIFTGGRGDYAAAATKYAMFVDTVRTYMADYAEYLTQKAAYDLDPTLPEPVEPTKPVMAEVDRVSLVSLPTDALFCDMKLTSAALEDASHTWFNNYGDGKLEQILRKDAADEYIYFEKSLNGTSCTQDTKDGNKHVEVNPANNYLYEGSADCIGIGSYRSDYPNGKLADGTTSIADSDGKYIVGAFQDVQYNMTLTLGDKVSKIADYAFFESFITSVNMPGNTDIGIRSFYACPFLTSVVLARGTQTIGTEAFYGCVQLSECMPDDGSADGFTLPAELKEIGYGAFAQDTKINRLNLSNIDNAFGCDIKDYAFFGCTGLNSIEMSTGTINSLGNGVFAVENKGSVNNLQEVTMPELKNTSANYGDYMFYNRDALHLVNIPSGYGSNASQLIYDNFIGNCENVNQLHFSDQTTSSCSKVKFNSTRLFKDCVNPQLYVYGPELKDVSAAGPRVMTAGSYMKMISTDANKVFIPYCYTNSNGVLVYEVQDGGFILTIDGDGTLISCKKADDGSTDPTLVVPSMVGSRQVIGVQAGCFEDVKDDVVHLIVEDGSLNSIADEVFKEFPLLETVDLGNSVATIGNRAFYNCPRLENVVVGTGVTSVGNEAFAKNPALTNITFEDPGPGVALNIGTDALKTESSKLTVHGKIEEGYAPFEWSMDENNLIDDLGTRVCYQAPSPTYIKIIRDNATGLVTLIDYPRFDLLDIQHGPLGDNYYGEITDYYYNLYSASTYDGLRESFKNAWNQAIVDGVNPETIYDTDDYGPWVYPAYIVAESGNWGGTTPEPYFTHVPYSIIDKYYNDSPRGDWEITTLREEEMIEATKQIKVPAGVESVDIQGFMKESKNSQNKAKYVSSDVVGDDVYKMYTEKKTDVDDVLSVPGLFSGYYLDFPGGSDFEKQVRGNDCVTSISLNSVEKLPDYCFDNCEQLVSVDIGPDCKDIGNAPFRGCENLTVVGGNDNYVFDNGIIYSVNPDGVTYTIEECLASRGNTVGSAIINAANDTLLPNVAYIKPGAFEECDHISNVDLSCCDNLKTIPEAAFRNCANLAFVTLPETVDLIETEAFAGDTPISVTIPGVEVHISTNAFELKPTTNIRTYEDSAALEYAKYHHLSYEIISDKYRVVFMDYDGSLLGEIQYIISGGSATAPADPVRPDYTFTGWSGEYTNITEDTFLVAQYKKTGSDDPSPVPKPVPGPNDPDGKTYTVTVINGSGSGSYVSGTTVNIIANSQSGKKFNHWSSSSGVAFANTESATTTFKMPNGNVTVTAVFDSTSSSTVSGNTNGKNNSANANTVGTRVTINRPGISNTNLASAKVNGSKDNFIVKIAETMDATSAVETALINRYGSLDNLKYFPMDITLWDSTGNTKITDTTGITIDITIPIPDSLKEYGGNNKTASVVDSQLEDLAPKFTTIDGVPCVTFTARHFSPYVIYVDTQNLTSGTTDITPKTADGIHPKWFLSVGLACVAILLFFKKDRKIVRKVAV